MTWNTDDPLVGERVIIFTSYGEEEPATVLAVHDRIDSLRVRADDGDILIGNQWQPID